MSNTIIYYFKLCLPFKLSRAKAEFSYFKYNDKAREI